MAQVDVQARRIDAKVVYWGPPRGGKTTTLRSLHGACDPASRGQLASVDTEDERTYYFDYAPLELPRRRDFAVRVHAYTVPGQEAYVETRRRILRGATAVVFVADTSPGATESSVSSWRQLDDALRRLEGGGTPLPVVVAANKQDVPGAVTPEEMLRLLRAAVPERQVLSLHGTSALDGRRVVRCFREALAVAVDASLAAVSPVAPPGDAEDRRRFVEALPARLGGGEDGVPIANAPARRTVHVPMSSYDPDAGGLEAALEAHRWLGARDMDVRELRRESALARLTVDLAQLCLSAGDADPLVRSVLATLVMSLEAVTGWAGLPDTEGGERVLDAMGLASDGSGVSETARLLHVGCADGRAVPVGEGTSASLPGGAAGGRGLFVPFSVGGGRRGWLLILGPPGRGLPTDAESALATAGAFLGLSVARFAATRALRAGGTGFETRVAERTRDLVAEKSALEARLVQRTRELEEARRAAPGTDRHGAAVGAATEPGGVVAHALRVAREVLSDVRGALDRAASDGGRLDADDLGDLAADVEDALRGLGRAEGRMPAAAPVSAPAAPVAAPPAPRREVTRTALAAAARDAIRAFRAMAPAGPAPRLVEREGVWVGAPADACTRWIHRVLDLVTVGRPADLRLETHHEGMGGPRLVLVSDEAIPAASAAGMAEVALEMERSGGRLVAASPDRRGQVVMSFPASADTGAIAVRA